MRKRKSLTITGILGLLLILGAFLFVSACSSSPSPTSSVPTSSAPAAPKTTAPSTSAAPSQASSTSSAPTSAGKTYTLKAVGAFAKSNTAMIPIGTISDLVKQRSNGQLTINWIGGPEAIAAADQPSALRNGTVDFIITAASYYQKQVPQIGAANLCQYSYSEQQSKGIYDYWNSIHGPLNARFLGWENFGGPYYMYLNKPIKDPKTDFKGLKIRSGTIYDSFIKALGGVTVTVAANEAYSALQTGVVDGAGWVPDQVDTNKAYEVIKYWVDIPFYNTAMSTLINTDSFNALPKNLQDLLTSTVTEVENKSCADYLTSINGYVKKFADLGMKPITFSKDDTTWFTKTAYDSAWADLKKTLSADDYDKLYKMLNK